MYKRIVFGILSLLLVLGNYFLIWKLFTELSIWQVTVTSIFKEIYLGNFGNIKKKLRFGLISS